MKKLIAAFLLGLTAAAWAQTEASSATPLFTAALHNLNDQPANLEGLRGRSLVVNFWARWCAPCRQEIPVLVAAHDYYGKRGLVVVGIALDDKPDSARDFVKAYDMRYPNYLAKAKGIELMQAVGNPKAVLPFTIAIGHHGQVVGKKLGPLKKEELEAYARQLLGKG